MKRIPAIIAWVGVAVVLTASVPTFNISWWWITRPETAGRVTEGVIISIALGVLGLLPAAIGGFFARSRAIAWGIIIAGAIYLLAFVPWAVQVPSGHEWLTALPPGAVCVMCGCSLLTTRHRGWWFAASFGIPVIIVVSAVGIPALLNAPVYQPVELQSLEVGSDELTLTFVPTGGYYRLVTNEKDGYTWEYLRLWVQGASSKYIEVRPPRSGSLMLLLEAGTGPLDQIAVPEVEYKAVVWTEDAFGRHGLNVEYNKKGSWSFNVRPVCVSYTKRDDEERYVIFRLKEHIPGERLVIEYRYSKPVPER